MAKCNEGKTSLTPQQVRAGVAVAVPTLATALGGALLKGAWANPRMWAPGADALKKGSELSAIGGFAGTPLVLGSQMEPFKKITDYLSPTTEELTGISQKPKQKTTKKRK